MSGEFSEGDRLVLQRALELMTSSLSGGRAGSSSSEATPGTSEATPGTGGRLTTKRVADLATTPRSRATSNPSRRPPGGSKAVYSSSS